MCPISIVRRIFLGVAVLASMAAAPAASAQGFTCTVSLGIAELFLSIGRLDFDLTYAPAEIVMVGSGAQVACVGLASDINAGLVPASFYDDDDGTVSGSFVSEAGFPGFTPLALCTLTASFAVDETDFSAAAVQTVAADGAAIVPQPEISITGADCAAGTTTTTTIDSTTTTSTTTTTTTTSTTLGGGTTTTTLEAQPGCGDPDGSGRVTASDSLFVLNVSVGLQSCALRVCDVDSSGVVSASDALLVLRVAVQLGDSLNCPT